MPETLFQKVWNRHVVKATDEATLLYIDRHSGPRGHQPAGVRRAPAGRPEGPAAGPDHRDGRPQRADRESARHPRADVAPAGRDAPRELPGVRRHPVRRPRRPARDRPRDRAGTRAHPPRHDDRLRRQPHQHPRGVRGPRLRDRDVSEVEHVLATQTLWQGKRPTSFGIEVRGQLAPGLEPKDIILAIIRQIGTGGATGTVVEYYGPAIEALSMEGRLTICNMSIEAGARAGLIAPDDTTIQYLANREPSRSPRRGRPSTRPSPTGSP